MSLSIRVEQPGDELGIREVNEQAFGEPLEARLIDALRDSLRGTQDFLSLVATLDEHVVGHILFTPITIEPARNCPIAGLAPMAVRPNHQRSGIGGQLIRAGLKEYERVLRSLSVSPSVTGRREGMSTSRNTGPSA